MREALELHAVRTLASRANTTEDLASLQRVADELLQLINELDRTNAPVLDDDQMQRFESSDIGFHIALLRRAGNRRSLKVVNQARQLIGFSRSAGEATIVYRSNESTGSTTISCGPSRSESRTSPVRWYRNTSKEAAANAWNNRTVGARCGSGSRSCNSDGWLIRFKNQIQLGVTQMKANIRFRLIRLTGLSMILAGTPLLGHHSFAGFDLSKMISLTGTVKEFQWVNPHSWIQLMVPDASGTRWNGVLK